MATSFKLEHDFPDIPLDKFVAHLNDPALNRMMKEGLGFEDRILLSRIEQPDGIEWQFKVKMRGDLPGAVKKIIKSDSFGWQETSRLVIKENRIYWHIDSEGTPLKFHGEGTYTFVPCHKGCKRVVEGSVKVDIPFVGKMVETFIINELLRAFEIEPAIQKKFYASIA